MALAWTGPLPGTSLAQSALELRPVEIVADVYAVIGDLGPQTYENHGFNANLGFVIGSDGVMVIDSGPSHLVAQALHRAIRKVTDRPVRWVVNTNSQANRWLGNGYFAELGIPVLAHRQALRHMKEFGGTQLESAERLLRDRATQTRLAFPTKVLEGRHTLDLGGHLVDLMHFGPAHTPGDTIVWLPREEIAYAGDIVYTERLLALLPVGNLGGWLKAFDAFAALRPRLIVPGHGRVTDLAAARHDTRDYLEHLRKSAKQLLDSGVSVIDAARRTDQSRFAHLANFKELANRNAEQAYMDMEFE
jgi:glyoxylase-like metal-dependent hydrolase (beta-lactamase superfamily II)